MNDSSYSLSLSSPAKQLYLLLTSEADRLKIKRSRAEEEIVRVWRSVYDSPSKSSAVLGFSLSSSSPLYWTRKLGHKYQIPSRLL